MIFGKEICGKFIPEDINNYDVLYTKDNLRALLSLPCMFLYNGFSLRYVSFEILSLYQPDMAIIDTSDLFTAINIPASIYQELKTISINKYRVYRDYDILVILSEQYMLLGTINYYFLEGLCRAFIKYSAGTLSLKKLGDYE